MCRWCHEPCGDREFCSEDCYEEWITAQAEVYDDLAALVWVGSSEEGLPSRLQAG
jgi:hypothetical protein